MWFFSMKHFAGVKLICIHLCYLQDHDKDFSEVLEWISENGREEPEAKGWNAQCNIPADNEHQNSPQHSLDTRVYQ